MISYLSSTSRNVVSRINNFFVLILISFILYFDSWPGLTSISKRIFVLIESQIGCQNKTFCHSIYEKWWITNCRHMSVKDMLRPIPLKWLQPHPVEVSQRTGLIFIIFNRLGWHLSLEWKKSYARRESICLHLGRSIFLNSLDS